MPVINQELDPQEVGNLSVFLQGGTAHATSDQAGVLSAYPHTHGLREGAWTSGSAHGLEHDFKATNVVVTRISAAAALASQRVGKGWFIGPYIPSDDTSPAIDYVPRMSAAEALASQRVRKACFTVTYIPGDDTSPAVDYVPKLKRHLRLHEALLRRVSENPKRLVARILSDSDVSINDLGQKFQESAPANLAARQRQLLARAGGGLTTTEVAQRLNLSEQEVDELRTAGRLLGVPDPDGPGWTYPSCQFEGPRVVFGLSEVLSDFSVKSPWTRLYVLSAEDPALDGRTPFEALQDGDLDKVREVVRGYGEQGGD